MTTTIPNTSTSGTVGTPSPAPIATESYDGSVTVAPSDIIQLMTLTYEFRQMLNLIAQALSLSVDPGTGRLRVVLENYGTPSNNGSPTASGITVVTAAANSNMTISNISAAVAGGNKPDTMIFDAMQNAWANSINFCVARS